MNVTYYNIEERPNEDRAWEPLIVGFDSLDEAKSDLDRLREKNKGLNRFEFRIVKFTGTKEVIDV